MAQTCPEIAKNGRGWPLGLPAGQIFGRDGPAGIFVKKCAKNTKNKALKGLIWFGNNSIMILGVSCHV